MIYIYIYVYKIINFYNYRKMLLNIFKIFKKRFIIHSLLLEICKKLLKF